MDADYISDIVGESFLETDHGMYIPAIFPCVVSSLMVVDGLWDLGLHLNLTQDTICDT